MWEWILFSFVLFAEETFKPYQLSVPLTMFLALGLEFFLRLPNSLFKHFSSFVILLIVWWDGTITIYNLFYQCSYKNDLQMNCKELSLNSAILLANVASMDLIQEKHYEIISLTDASA